MGVADSHRPPLWSVHQKENLRQQIRKPVGVVRSLDLDPPERGRLRRGNLPENLQQAGDRVDHHRLTSRGFGHQVKIGDVVFEPVGHSRRIPIGKAEANSAEGGDRLAPMSEETDERPRYRCPDWLAERFRTAGGRMAFDEFVDAALYDPANGYYGRGVEVIGPAGDYVTGSTLHPAFARALLRVTEDVLDLLEDEPSGDPVDFVDAGAGSGRFLEALASAASISPRLASRLRLHAVERSDGLRARIAARNIVPRPQLHADAAGLPNGLRGIVFAYELFDALPFARFIGLEDGSVGEEIVELDAADQTIRVEIARPTRRKLELVEAEGISLEPGQEIEIAPAATALYRTLAERLDRGIVLTFDYGARARALYSPVGRFHGTATAYRGHRAHRGLLEAPGEQDLTAHVNFSALERAGSSAGFRTLALTGQAQLLFGAGLGEELAATSDTQSRSDLVRLVDPEGMGGELRVLVQAKGFDDRTPLKFLNFNNLRR